MKEAQFIKLRKPYWDQVDQQSGNGRKRLPDELAEEYIAVSDDLSYSRTFYPKSKTTAYLNERASRLHQRIYKNRKENTGRFFRFWMDEVPREMARTAKSMYLSLGVFLLACFIGAVSMEYNPDFARVILGDSYVDLTERNILNEDPMAIYASDSQTNMFLRITTNNIRVSFIVFVLGILTPLFPLSLLFTNGIMLGCFQYLFYQQDVLGISAQAIWIHGTIEITSIVVAGGAGIHMGAGWLFPGTLTRMESFRKHAASGMKVCVALVPFFILAGFLESFVTRFYQTPAVSIPVIVVSVGLVIWYFIYLPFMKNKYESGK